MKYYQAKSQKDFEFIASLFNPRNNQFMMTKKTTARRMKHTSKFPGRNHYILIVDDKKIGWFNVRKQIDASEGMFGMIIDKPYQGHGYGTQAMQLIEKEAKRLGIKRLKLEVFMQNTKAIKLYRRAGFKQTGKLLAMEKKL